jgi:hypothetical protein
VPKINVNAVRNHVERLIPAGDYEVKFVKVEEKVAQSGREWFNITCEFQDTIPSGLVIDEEVAVDPVASKQKMFKGVFFPMDGDKPGTISMFNSSLKSLLLYSECNPASEEELNPSDLINLYCGVKIAHKPINKDDPDSDKRAEIVSFVPLAN